MIELEDNGLKRTHSKGTKTSTDSIIHTGEYKATNHNKPNLLRLLLGVGIYTVFLLYVLTLLVMNRNKITIEIADSTIFIFSVAIFIGLISTSLFSLSLLSIGYVISAWGEDRDKKIKWTMVEKPLKYSLSIFYVVVVVSMVCISLPPMIYVISPADAPLTFLLGLVLPGIILTIGIYGLDVRTPIVVGLFLLGATAVTLALNMSEIADLIAICAYYFLVVGVVLNFIASVREGDEEDKPTQNSLSA